MSTRYLKSSKNGDVFPWTPELAIRKEGSIYVFNECDIKGNLKEKTLRPPEYLGCPITSRAELNKTKTDVEASKGEFPQFLLTNETEEAIEYMEKMNEITRDSEKRIQQEVLAEMKKQQEAARGNQAEVTQKIDKLTDSVGQLAEIMKMMLMNQAKPEPFTTKVVEVPKEIVQEVAPVEVKKRGRKPKV